MQPGIFMPQNFNWMLGFNPMPINNNGMQGMNFDQLNYLNMIYGQGIDFNKFNQQPITSRSNIVTIQFKTTQAVKTIVKVNYDKTVSDTILLYLKRMNKPELFDKSSGIFFLYNANKVDIYDKSKIGDFLGGITYPTIMVNDVKNLIGA